MGLAKTLMIQGTASHVGKSVMTAALCRIFKNRGIRVAPFKAQNMSNNSYVTPEGLEIARAQAVQAEACGIEPHVWMSPVLLKPESDQRVQTVVMGKPWGKKLSLLKTHYAETLKPIVLDALHKLRQQYELVVIEGAGSPAEVNLQANDIVNMGVAREVKAPVILVGDIDMGGVFAQFVGTLELIEPKDRKLIKAFLINKFRGNLKLLEPGLDWLASKTKRPVLGVVPFLADIDLAEEDSLSERDTQTQGLRANRLFDQVSGRKRDRRILVQNNDELLIDILWLPRVSNFTDFDLLVKSPGVRVRWLHEPDRHTQPDLIFIPGTKSTLADLNFLRRSGLADYIFKAARAGSWVFGICGGYQMLGESLEDPSGVESRQRHSAGLGLLPVQTVFSARKETHQISAVHLASGLEVRGYEVHMGRTRIIDGVKVKRLFKIAARSGKEQRDAFEGIDFKRAKSRIFGSYMHGLFQNRNFLEVFMGELRAARGLKSALFNTPALHGFGEDRLYDAVAEKVKKAIDMDFLLKIADI